MTPAARAPGGAPRRIILIAAPLLLLVAAYGFSGLGVFLAREDPIEKADAIFVLAGTSMRRQLEGADLYLAGFSPRIVLSRETPERGLQELRARGIALDDDVARVRDVFLRLGIPADAILTPDRIHDSTAAEAVTLRELVQAHAWRRVIVVTSRYHLRRAGYALRRELRGSPAEVLMHPTRYERFEPERWWRRRSDIREIIPEVPKLLAYVLGLGA